MTRLSKTVYLAIHGHFYQPPRENPWTERIEHQPDARPFHDWNDRILIQCYQPNAMARIVDDKGKVLEIVNNFRLISFNVGPTLLSWLEKHVPVVYYRILEGDRLSVHERSGHGNALAQVYNHMILPLAREQDQRTQIRWGIFEFKKRFGRDPEGMWLPETAASERTLEILIEEGIRFTILAPEQAEKIRPLQVEGEKGDRRPSSAEWAGVTGGKIDPTRPYRFFHSKEAGRFLDLFFFDGPLSRDMSFSDLLFDAKGFIDRLKGAHHRDRHHPELVHVASDGESFGHHKAYGERVIAFLLHEEAEQHGFKRTNYGEYLEKFPPQYEVRIRPGEGSSWSCAHGVGRWKEDCGCRTGGEAGWNQKWRTPLREAVRFLAEETGKLYDTHARPFLKDPPAARDAYIELILDRSQAAREKFFEDHSARGLLAGEEIQCLKLLEMERYALLSETSCGWFFNDISGIETVQILRYALRAFELAREFGGEALEDQFVAILAHAKGNRTETGDGRSVWEKRVKPAVVSREKLVAHFAFRKLFGLEIQPGDFYNQEVEEGESEEEPVEEMRLLMGALRMRGKTVPEENNFLYAIFQEQHSRVYCFVKETRDPAELHRLVIAPLGLLRKKDAAGLFSKLQQDFGRESFSLRDLFPEERDEVLRILSHQMREDLYRMAARFYEQDRPEISIFREAGRALPEEFRELMEWMMGERLCDVVKRLGEKAASSEVEAEGKKLLAEAKEGGFSVHTGPAVEYLSSELNRWIEKLFHKPESALVKKIEEVLDLAKSLGMSLHHRIAQDLFFAFAQKILSEWIETYPEGTGGEQGARGVASLQMIQAVIRLGGQLDFNMRQYEEKLKQKVRVG